MVSKKEKVKEINERIKRSKVARDNGAGAFITQDGRIEYFRKTTTRTGKEYQIKISFQDVIVMLQYNDMVYLFNKYGAGRKRPLKYKR